GNPGDLLVLGADEDFARKLRRDRRLDGPGDHGLPAERQEVLPRQPLRAPAGGNGDEDRVCFHSRKTNRGGTEARRRKTRRVTGKLSVSRCLRGEILFWVGLRPRPPSAR